MALTVLAPQQLDPMLSLCCCNADSCAGLCNAHWDACRRCESVDYCGVYYSALPHGMLSGVTAMLPLCCKLVTGVHAAPGQNSNHWAACTNPAAARCDHHVAGSRCVPRSRWVACPHCTAYPSPCCSASSILHAFLRAAVSCCLASTWHRLAGVALCCNGAL